MGQVHKPQLGRVHVQLLRQLVHGGLHGKAALGGAVTAEGTGGHGVGVHHVPGEAEGGLPGVEGDALVAHQADGGGGVLAVSTGVGQGVHIHRLDGAVLHGAHFDVDPHLVAAVGCLEGLLPGVHDFGGLAGAEGDQSGEELADQGLLGAEAAADAGLHHPHHVLGQAQSMGDGAAAVEGHLGGGYHVEPPVMVQIGIGAEGLHHGLGVGLGIIGLIHHHVAGSHGGIHVAVGVAAAGHQVALRVAADVEVVEVVILRMNHNWVVQSGLKVQHRLQNVILHLDHAHSLGHAVLVPTGHNGHRVAHIADGALQDVAVIGGGLRVGLARQGIADLGHVLPGQDAGDAGHPAGGVLADGLDTGVGVGAAEHLDHQAVTGHHVLGVHALAAGEGGAVQLGDGLIDEFQIHA